jgi:hypothetical protein
LGPEDARADAAQEDVQHEQQQAGEQQRRADALARLGAGRARIQDFGRVREHAAARAGGDGGQQRGAPSGTLADGGRR